MLCNKSEKGNSHKNGGGANMWMFVRIFNKIESKQRLGVFLRFTCFTLKILEFISFAVCDLILQWIPYKAHTYTQPLFFLPFIGFKIDKCSLGFLEKGPLCPNKSFEQRKCILMGIKAFESGLSISSFVLPMELFMDSRWKMFSMGSIRFLGNLCMYIVCGLTESLL